MKTSEGPHPQILNTTFCDGLRPTFGHRKPTNSPPFITDINLSMLRK
ncbi:hypothetical protein [Acaryochloris marina]|nr:hypothetical protein [Acaryochloris marina]QUY42579.1 hypothetical protein I1H34_26040 [Acaryochloris marina S15]